MLSNHRNQFVHIKRFLIEKKKTDEFQLKLKRGIRLIVHKAQELCGQCSTEVKVEMPMEAYPNFKM